MQVLGVETSLLMQDVVRSKLGTDVIWTAELTVLPAIHFDVIALINVIEHVHHPDQILRALSNLLRPGDLLVLHTMNFTELPSRIYGPR